MSQQQQPPRSGGGGGGGGSVSGGPRPRIMSAASSTRVIMPVSYDIGRASGIVSRMRDARDMRRWGDDMMKSFFLLL